MSKTHEAKQGHTTVVEAPAPERNVLANPPTAPSAATAVAFMERLKLTEQECNAALTAKDVPPAVLDGLARVSLVDMSQAFVPEEVDAIEAPDSGLKLKPTQLQALPGCAERVAVAAAVVSKLETLVAVVEHAARKDADLLDSIAHALVPQLTAQALVDDTVEVRHQPLLAYWRARFPGGPKGPRTPKAPPAPVTPTKA